MPSRTTLSPNRAALLVIDVQEKLAAAMPPDVMQRMVRNLGVLVETSRRLGLPVVVTEQYPKGLGPTLPAVSEMLSPLGEQVQRFEKVDFSVCGNRDFQGLYQTLCRDQWLILGMESHICVWQSVRDLRNRGAIVHVMTDAVASRTEENRKIGLDLCERAGALMSSTETAMFDLLGKAGTDDFKVLSKLIR